MRTFYSCTCTKKIENPYVPPIVQNAKTIENETKKAIDNFLKNASEFNKVVEVATNQRKENYFDELFDV